MRDRRSHPLLNEVTRNPFVWGAIGLCVGLLALAVYAAPLAGVLSLRPPSGAQWLLIPGGSLFPLAVGQAYLMVASGPGPEATLSVLALALVLAGLPPNARAQEADVIPLPDPVLDGDLSVERALVQRRSVRELAADALQLEELGQLVWAAQGITEPTPAPEDWSRGEWGGGLRTAPSAGALYPLELYVLATNVAGLEAGLYRYRPGEHGLERVGAPTGGLAAAALGQRAIAEAPAVLVIAATYRRTAAKYGDRAERYVHIEVGAAAENVYLQAEVAGLATVFIGAFRDEQVQKTLALPDRHAPLGLMPVGRPGP